ncbi:hypothetical protein [Acinetobacter pittii]|uniref:hypothetical protein n=1 Tax=Acinetobacter pittii TaxID=48296 RepID=UPI0019337C66|nr:hypothetical protein [Acinetobacter pittii]QRF07618.1 hypothetical protein HRJ47_06330 [Acinetobacter pittii]
MSDFKVGDYVVFKDEPILRSITQVFKIKGLDGDRIGQIYTFEDSVDGLVYGYEDQLRLATPQEIAAGHRIDCEILDHPEDYTSPNCKKFDERVK